MAGWIHVFWPDGGKYRVAGFEVSRFDAYSHSVLMFMSVVEGSPQLVRGSLMVLSGFLFPEFLGALVMYDALEGIFVIILGGYYCGGVKPLPSPPRGADGTVPGSKLLGFKTTLMTTMAIIWIIAGRPVVKMLPLWAITIPCAQIPAMLFMFSRKFPAKEEAQSMVEEYLVNKGKGAALF